MKKSIERGRSLVDALTVEPFTVTHYVCPAWLNRKRQHLNDVCQSFKSLQSLFMTLRSNNDVNSAAFARFEKTEKSAFRVC